MNGVLFGICELIKQERASQMDDDDNEIGLYQWQVLCRKYFQSGRAAEGHWDAMSEILFNLFECDDLEGTGLADAILALRDASVS